MPGVAGNLVIVYKADTGNFTAQTKAAAKQLGVFEASATSAGKTARAQMADARGTVMVLGEEIGVHLPRHVQAFVAKLPGAATALSAAFDATAVLAIGVAVFEAGKKIYEFAEKNEEAARKNAAAWRTISGSMQTANDDLQVANDKLELAIAKLEYKPENGLKLAIDEAIQSADTLGAKLDADAQKIADTLKAQQGGGFVTFMGAATDTSGVTGRAQALQDQLAGIDVQARTHLMALKKQGAAQTEIDAATADLAAQRKAAIDKELNEWALPQMRVQQKRLAADSSSHAGGAAVIQPLLTALAGYAASLGQMSDFIDLSQAHGVLEGKEAQAQAGHENAELAAKAWAAEFEAEKNAAAERAKLLVDSPEKDYRRNGNGDIMAGRETRNRVFESTLGAPSAPSDLYKNIGSEMEIDIGRFGPQYREFYELVAKNSMEQTKLQANLALTKTHIAEATGAITPHVAALIEAQSHTAQYARELDALKGQLADLSFQALDPAERATQGQKLKNQIDDLQGQRQVQSAQDQATIKATSTMGEFEARLVKTADEFTNLGAVLGDFTLHVLDSVNETLMKMLSTPANEMRGKHPWRNLGESTAESAGSAALKYSEGQAMKLLFGKNPNAKLGTQGNPMWIKNADDAGSAALNGVLSKLFGGGSGTSSAPAGNAAQSIASTGLGFAMSVAGLPHFATGGAIPADMPSIVGENGPEMFMPRNAGSIIPNGKFGGGGDVHVHINAGGNDPAANAAAVHRAMAAYLPHLPAMALAAKADRDRRMPAGRRS